MTSSHAIRAGIAGALLTVVSLPAHADVTLQEQMSIRGSGLMKMINMNGTSTTVIAGDRARTESDLQFESGMMRTLSRGAGASTEIVRLDRDTVYVLDDRKKTYTETTFSERRSQLEQAMAASRDSQASQQAAASGVDESRCEWSDPQVNVSRTGQTRAIAGHQAERITIMASQSCTDRNSGQVCEFGLLLDQWLAPEFAAAGETQAYHQKYAQSLGLDAVGSRDFAQRAQSMFGAYEGMWQQVGEQMREVKGHPVSTSFSLGIGGPQCTSAQQMQQSGNSGPGVGGALGAIGGLLGRRKAEPAQPEPQATQVLPGGLTPLMTISSELIAVSHDPAPADRFEVPAGYRKVSE